MAVLEGRAENSPAVDVDCRESVVEYLPVPAGRMKPLNPEGIPSFSPAVGPSHRGTTLGSCQL